MTRTLRYTSDVGEFIEDTKAVVAIDTASFPLLQDQPQSALGILTERRAGVIRLRSGLVDRRAHTLGEIA